jgi:hypothetical protein
MSQNLFPTDKTSLVIYRAWRENDPSSVSFPPAVRAVTVQTAPTVEEAYEFIFTPPVLLKPPQEPAKCMPLGMAGSRSLVWRAPLVVVATLVRNCHPRRDLLKSV